MDVKVGDMVLYAKYGGTEVKLDSDSTVWSCARATFWRSSPDKPRIS